MLKSVAGSGCIVGGVVLALLLVSASGCQTASSAGRAQHHGEVQAKEENLPEALAAFERAAALADNETDRTRAYISMARVLIQQGEWSRAVNTLQRARTQYRGAGDSPGGKRLVGAIHRVMGEAHFHAGNFVLARRYLEKGIAGSAGEERQLTLARLYACYLTVGETAMARAYLERLQPPLTSTADRIVASAPRLAQAYAARQRARTQPARRRAQPHHHLPDDRRRKPNDSLRLRPLSVLSRAHWSARSPRKNVTQMGKITRLTVHHAGGPEFWAKSKSASSAEIRRIQRVHQERHWADIGYHYVVDRAGRVWRGRSLKHQGAHARGHANRGNIGVLLLGNLIRQQVTEAQKRSLAALVARLTTYYNIQPYRVYTHREILRGKTACPGPAVTRLVNKIRAALEKRELAAR